MAETRDSDRGRGRLSTVSMKYDKSRKGYLSDSQKAARDADADGKGYLTAEEAAALAKKCLMQSTTTTNDPPAIIQEFITTAAVPVVSARPIMAHHNQTSATPLISCRMVPDPSERGLGRISLGTTNPNVDTATTTTTGTTASRVTFHARTIATNTVSSSNNNAAPVSITVPCSPAGGVWSPSMIHLKTEAVNDCETDDDAPISVVVPVSMPPPPDEKPKGPTIHTTMDREKEAVGLERPVSVPAPPDEKQERGVDTEAPLEPTETDNDDVSNSNNEHQEDSNVILSCQVSRRSHWVIASTALVLIAIVATVVVMFAVYITMDLRKEM
ncbi:expressed unknown protein [Seminavis robusta]|uniref:EF-hand domain-containing protein n=1 Tax=Seminavis robusta TaxID=568900 RepID=A0A9N8E0H3_9STRA|nr:expressed unknown protein [Seminavis robusta]|eukprot:Sro523_g159830.1 n/a (328) ;mRNA; f:48298-49281